MAGLSQEQIKQLEGMEGINQELLSNYKATNPAPIQSEEDVSTGEVDFSMPENEESGEGLNNLDLALNTAIDLGRQERKDMVLDFHGGIIPAGALPASSFASILDSFNRSAAPIENTLLDAALDDKDIVLETQNSIRDLALSVATETGDTKSAQMIAALAAKGDMDGAVELAVIAYGDEYVREGGGFVKVDKDGNRTVVWESPETTSGGEYTPGNNFGWEDNEVEQLNNEFEEDWRTTTSYQEQNNFLNGPPDQEILAIEQALGATVGDGDKKTNPQTYLKWLGLWEESKRTRASFFKLFPPNKWLNYSDPTIPSYIKNEMTAPKKDDSGDSDDKDLYNLSNPGYGKEEED